MVNCLFSSWVRLELVGGNDWVEFPNVRPKGCL